MLISIVIAIIFMAMLTLPVIGSILNIVLGLLWAYCVWDFFKIYRWSFVADSIFWAWGIRLLIGLFCIGLHMGSLAELGIDSFKSSVNYRGFTKDKRYTNHRKANYNKNDFYSHRSEQSNNSYERQNRKKAEKHEDSHRQEEKSSRKEQNQKQSDLFDPFAGCKTKESVMKRYKSLCKNFHPDTADGDMEQMQILNVLYEKKMKEME